MELSISELRDLIEMIMYKREHENKIDNQIKEPTNIIVRKCENCFTYNNYNGGHCNGTKNIKPQDTSPDSCCLEHKTLDEIEMLQGHKKCNKMAFQNQCFYGYPLDCDKCPYRNSEDETEKLRMQLAACGVAALSNTEQSALMNRLKKDSPYWTSSYQNVCDAVDREMALRKENENLKTNK